MGLCVRPTMNRHHIYRCRLRVAIKREKNFLLRHNIRRFMCSMHVMCIFCRCMSVLCLCWCMCMCSIRLIRSCSVYRQFFKWKIQNHFLLRFFKIDYCIWSGLLSLCSSVYVLAVIIPFCHIVYWQTFSFHLYQKNGGEYLQKLFVFMSTTLTEWLKFDREKMPEIQPRTWTFFVVVVEKYAIN